MALDEVLELDGGVCSCGMDIPGGSESPRALTTLTVSISDLDVFIPATVIGGGLSDISADVDPAIARALGAPSFGCECGANGLEPLGSAKCRFDFWSLLEGEDDDDDELKLNGKTPPSFSFFPSIQDMTLGLHP